MPSHIRRALILAVTVGALLVIINQGDVILSALRNPEEWTASLVFKLLFTPAVPFAVSLLSSTLSNRESSRIRRLTEMRARGVADDLNVSTPGTAETIRNASSELQARSETVAARVDIVQGVLESALARQQEVINTISDRLGKDDFVRSGTESKENLAELAKLAQEVSTSLSAIHDTLESIRLV